MLIQEKISFACAFLLCFCCFGLNKAEAKGQTGVGAHTALASAVDAAIEKAMKANRLVGAVVLVSLDGELVYHHAAGYADREAQTPMREDAIFRFSSVSKPFTSMAAAALLQQGVLHLDDPITKWLPDFKPTLPGGGTAVITVRHLMSHTAGLNYRFGEKKGGPYSRAGVSDGMDISRISLDENVKRIASAPLLFKPGTTMQYSLATDVLGAVIAKASGTTLPQAMQRLVTGPLGIKDTGFSVTDASRLTTPYKNASPRPARMKDDDVISNIHFAPKRILDATEYPSGGAGMAGTASDVMRLLETIRKGGAPIAGPEIMKEMNSNQIGKSRVAPGLAFGLGWAVLVEPAASNSPESTGTLSWGGVYGHSWFVDPAKKLTVVIMTNTAFEGMSGNLVTDIRDAVYGNIAQ